MLLLGFCFKVYAHERAREKYKGKFEGVVRNFAKSWPAVSEKAMRIPKEGYRMAVVLTKEK